MTQKTSEIFIDDFYSKPPQMKHAINKSDVYQFEDVWSLHILDLKGYGPENNRGYRYLLAVSNNFSKFGRRGPLKNKNAQTTKVSFEKILIFSKRKPILIESDQGKEFYNNSFLNFL